MRFTYLLLVFSLGVWGVWGWEGGGKVREWVGLVLWTNSHISGVALSLIRFLDSPFTLKIGPVVSLSYIISHDGRNSIEIS